MEFRPVTSIPAKSAGAVSVVVLFFCIATIGFAACSNESESFGVGGDGGSISQGSGAGSPTGSGPGSTSVTTAASGSGHGGAGPGATGSGGAGGGPSGSGGAGGAGQGGMGQGGSAACSHDVCVIGAPLDNNCSPCVATLCDASIDPFCCDTEWDDACVSEVFDACGIDCGGTGGGGGAGGGAGTGGSGQGGGGTGGGGIVQPGDLVITEIMNNPAVVADASGEWFEVHNATASPIDMAGLVIRHSATATHTIASSVVVLGGGYVVFGLNGDASSNGGVAVDYVYPGAVNLSNTSDLLAIETADSVPVTIDITNWDEASGFDPDGASRSLSPAFLSAASNDNDAHFCAATSFVSGSAGDKGTPGAPNDPCP